jgi:hypothetical protein
MFRRGFIKFHTLKRKLIAGSFAIALAVSSVRWCASVLRTRNVPVAFAATAGYGTYTTTFPFAQNPVSEGGNWINGGSVGVDWNNVRSAGNVAQGSGPASSAYSDPTAILSGTWGPNQSVTATVYSNGVEDKPAQGYDKEVEIRLRTSISPHSIKGYEINCRTPGDSYSYIQIVRWNGALGDFTSLNILYGTGCSNGDVFKATISGGAINAYRNGNLMLTAWDSTYRTGNPGIGFNFGCGSAYDQFGLTNFTATDRSTSQTIPPHRALPQLSYFPMHSGRF